MEKSGFLDPIQRKAKAIEWYSTLEVLFKMSEFTQNREGAFLISKVETESLWNIRYLCLSCVRDYNYLLQKGLKVLHAPRFYNLYYSIAKFNKKFPFWTLSEERQNQKREWLQNRMLKDICGYDFFIDIDCTKESFESGKITVRKIHDLFNKYNIRHCIRSSGKGFHIIADYEQFSELNYTISEDYNDTNNVVNVFYNLAIRMKSKISDLIDTGMYDLRRVTKIPYSLVHYHDEIRVAFPFESWEEFESFTYEMGEVRNFQYYLHGGHTSWEKVLRYRETFIFNKEHKPDVKGFIGDVLKWEI